MAWLINLDKSLPFEGLSFLTSEMKAIKLDYVSVSFNPEIQNWEIMSP